jgi:hypothetical protein
MIHCSTKTAIEQKKKAYMPFLKAGGISEVSSSEVISASLVKRIAVGVP